MIKKLDIFDFDGTLFNSPTDTEANRKKYERITGMPWIIDREMSRQLSKKHGRHIGMRRGWWGRAETLEPPLVPDPAPKEWFKKEPCEAFLASKARSHPGQENPESITMLLTGRYSGLKEQVLRIMWDGGLMDVETVVSRKDGKKYFVNADEAVAFYCLGDKALSNLVDNGPMPSETFPWKMWVVGQYATYCPDLNTIEMWEDREEHVEKFQQELSKLVENVIIHHVV
jgi:hypothetical protein